MYTCLMCYLLPIYHTLDVHLDEDYTDVNTTVDLVGNLTINDNSKVEILFDCILA